MTQYNDSNNSARFRRAIFLGIAFASSATPILAKPVLEEVMVTAQKKTESLSDVPVSVTAVDGDKLAKAGISNMEDLSEYTPNFKLVSGGVVPNVYMRGVGSGSNQGFEMSVGIFSDGIHLGRSNQTRTAFLDVERVEVLRGPQSILFGKNAIAGALSIISAKPGDELEMMISGQTGVGVGKDNDRREVFAMISTPVTEKFGVRFAAKKREEDGYLTNEGQQRLEPQVDEEALRLTLGFTPTDWLDATLKLEDSSRKQVGRTLEMTHASALTGCSGEDVTLNRVRNTNKDERAEVDGYNYTLNVDMHFESGTVTSTTGWSGYDYLDLFDADSSSADTAPLDGAEKYSQFSQELRFTSSSGEFLDYTTGVFYQSSELEFAEVAEVKLRTAAVQDTGVCAANNAILAEADLTRDVGIDSDAWSAFAQFTFNWSDTVRTTLGVRHVVEEKTGFREVNVYGSGTRNDADPATLALFNAVRINPHYLDGERDANVTLPSVNTQWDITDDTMLYLVFSRGAKSGSFDARGNDDGTGPSGGATNFEFEDEIADAWELGTKMRLADGAAELNVAVYHVEYDDMQVSVFDGVAAFSVTNAGVARTQGVEMDGRWLLTEQFMLSGSLAYLDFKWLEYVDGPCYAGAPDENPDTGTCNFAGRENQQTPKWTGSLSGTYTQPVFDALLLEMAVDVSYRGEHFTGGDLDPRGVQEAVSKINARLALSDDTESWSVALVGRNLTDETTYGIGVPSTLDVGGYRVSVEPTRALYLEGRWRY